MALSPRPPRRIGVAPSPVLQPAAGIGHVATVTGREPPPVEKPRPLSR